MLLDLGNAGAVDFFARAEVQINGVPERVNTREAAMVVQVNRSFLRAFGHFSKLPQGFEQLYVNRFNHRFLTLEVAGNRKLGGHHVLLRSMDIASIKLSFERNKFSMLNLRHKPNEKLKRRRQNM